MTAASPNKPRRGLAFGIAALVLVAAAVGAYIVRSGGVDSVADAASIVPADASAVALVAPYGEVADGLSRLAARLDGSEGVLEALGVALGLQRFDRPSLQAAGLQAEGNGAVFLWRDHLWMALTGVQPAGRLHVVATLRQRGVTVTEAGPGAWTLTRLGWTAQLWAVEPGWLIGRWPVDAEIAAALGTAAPANGARAGDATVAAPPRPAADVDLSALRAATPAKRRLEAGETLRVSVPLAQGDALRPALRQAIGPAGLLFGRIVDNIQGTELRLSLAGEAPSLTILLRLPEAIAKEFAAYHQDFVPDERALDAGAVLPDEVAFWLRLRLNPALLGMIPGFLRTRLLPPTLLGRLHPALEKVDAQTLLLDALDGQLGVGLLGVDDRVTIGPGLLASVLGGRVAALQDGVGTFAFVGLRDAAAATRLVQACHDALVEGEQALQPRALGAGKGFVVPADATRHQPEVTVLAIGAAVWIVSGVGEFERFERAAAGRFPTLGKAAVGALEREVATGKQLWLAAGSTTGRIVRAARRRGVPEHFVRMIPPAATTRLRLSNDGVGLAIEVRPQPAEAK